MKYSWLKKTDSDKLIIFFSGFGCDENLLSDFDFSDCDAIAFYDYTNLDCELPREIFEYFETYTVAWSFGIWVADYFKNKLPNCKERVALCGSPYPIDDARGIAESVFNATLENFTKEGKEKFLLRVFGAVNFKKCKSLFSLRNAEDEKLELAALQNHFEKFKSSPEDWTRVIAAKSDKIFALKNLRAAWGDKLETVSGEHFPHAIFSAGIAKLFLNVSDVGKTFENSFAKYAKLAKVQKKIACRLSELVCKRIEPSAVKNILEIGVGTGFLTEAIAREIPNANWVLNDLSAQSLEYVRPILGDCKSTFIEGDAQIQDLPSCMDLIVSASCFQWFESLEGFFEKLAAISNPNAVMAFSTFLPDNLREIRSLSGKGLNYIGIVGIEALLRKAGFEILCAEAQTIKLEFERPIDVLKHLRDTGVTGTFSEFWTPAKMKVFSRQYSDFFPSEKGGVILTYRPAYFICKNVGKNSLETGEL